MYVVYEGMANGKSNSAMDCESPCHSQSANRKGWTATSSSSSSLTSPPRTISPSNYNLPAAQRLSLRTTVSTNAVSGAGGGHVLLVDPDAKPLSTSSSAFTVRGGHNH